MSTQTFRSGLKSLKGWESVPCSVFRDVEKGGVEGFEGFEEFGEYPLLVTGIS